MSTYPDQHGLALTCDSAKAAELFDETVTGYLGFKINTGHKLKQLSAEAPDMPMAVCLRGYLTMLVGNRKAHEKAKKLIVSQDKLANQTNLSEREKQRERRKQDRRRNGLRSRVLDAPEVERALCIV